MNYRHEPTFEELRPDMDRLFAETEANMTPEELARSRHKHTTYQHECVVCKETG